MTFRVPAQTLFVVMLDTHPSASGTLRAPDIVRPDPPTPVEISTGPFGNYCGHLVATPGVLRPWARPSWKPTARPTRSIEG